MTSESVIQFLEQLAASISATVGQLTGSEVKHNISYDQEVSSAELWAGAAIQFEPSCRLAFAISQTTGVCLAHAMLSEAPGDATIVSDEDREVLVEFWKQALGRASTDLKSQLEDSVIEYVDATAPEWQPAFSAAIDLESEKLKATIAVRLSLEAVRRISGSAEETKQIVAPVPAGNNLDLLLNVPLAVTLRFGQRRMPLREILQLSSGSIIELDRQADDAVDLLLDERLIARGQVVVVDGCYGLRVSEVCR